MDLLNCMLVKSILMLSIQLSFPNLSYMYMVT